MRVLRTVVLERGWSPRLAWGVVAALLALGLATAPVAGAAVPCPNANPVVNENQCHVGTTGWRVSGYSSNIGGFPTQSSTDLGDDVTLKIARNAPVFPAVSATIAVYRMGYYGGVGARLVHSVTGVVINNDFACHPMDPVTGKVDCGNWAPTYTIPGSVFPASGVYLAKVMASTGEQTHVLFTIRDDARPSPADVLFVLPTADYTAYNIFGGKSVYFGTEGGKTVSGTSRAVKVSFNRPLSTVGREKDWLFGPDYNTLYWLERQGYDVSYSDDVAVHRDPPALLDHNAIVIPGHSEYWSLEEYGGVKAARDAGVSVASLSANTAYWKVRYEDGERTLVCYKTVEGGGSNGSGSVSANDWGPDGVQGTADDALGADGKAGTADDRPENSTTTWRDDGAPPGDPNAPVGGRVGPGMPENSLWGVMYVGDNDAVDFSLTVPAANADEEFAADRVWRNTGIPANASTELGTEIVGWEWDAVPTQAQYLAHQPAGVKRVSATNVQVQSDNSWLQDEGRARATTPPPGQPGTVNAVKYTAPHGALVFAAGTNQWSLGLFEDADARLQQATYNILSDMGIQPATPDGVTSDPGSNTVPVARLAFAPSPAAAGAPVTFSGAGSSDANGPIVRYEWDLDGDGGFETDSGASPFASRAYGAPGAYAVRLRVTDAAGTTDRQARRLVVGAGVARRDRTARAPAGSPPVSPRALRRALRTRVAAGLRALERLGLRALRRRGSFVVRVRAPTAGRAVASLLAHTARRRARGRGPLLVAIGRRDLARPGTASIRVRVTRAGQRWLQRRARARLRLRLALVDAAGRKTATRGTVTVSRLGGGKRARLPKSGRPVRDGNG